jgi:hypothetical protein
VWFSSHNYYQPLYSKMFISPRMLLSAKWMLSHPDLGGVNWKTGLHSRAPLSNLGRVAGNSDGALSWLPLVTPDELGRSHCRVARRCTASLNNPWIERCDRCVRNFVRSVGLQSGCFRMQNGLGFWKLSSAELCWCGLYLRRFGSMCYLRLHSLSY